MTAVEVSLVYRLREKMGDNPTRLVVAGDVATTVYIDGVDVVAQNSDVGKTCSKVSDQVWSDNEYFDEINSQRTLIFKGKKSNNTFLSDLEQEILLLASRVAFIEQLAVNSARYAKYKIGQ